MQVSMIVSPLSSEEQTPFLDPMPQQIVLGHTTVTNECEEFVQGLNGGIQSYCEIDYERTAMTAQDLMNDLLATLQDQHTPLAWRLGFLAGQVAGFLTPEIAETGMSQSCVEVLSRKCKLLYPGPDALSSFIQ
jgi:hypothetical protein